MIDFNVPPFVGKELDYVKEAVANKKLCGDGPFTHKCSAWLQDNFQVRHAFLTTSCTHALEMAAILSGVEEGDEVIMPSYTFVSTGDAFVQRGAKLVFVDIRPETMNMDERLIEEALTPKTKAIVPVHYAGVSCEMDTILDIAARYGLKVVEDAAQGFDSLYKGKPLGTIGDFGCLSFHETKNLSMGEGGALMFQENRYQEKAEILREKGTDRSKFFRGQLDKYTWQDYGSSYLPSDLNAAFLWAQMEEMKKIQEQRMASHHYYEKALKPLAEEGFLEQMFIPDYAKHNAHMYYIKLPDIESRQSLIQYLKEHGILSVFHYIPLHNSPAGKRFGRFHGTDRYTTKESERLLRLPMYYGLKEEDLYYITNTITNYFKGKK